MCSLLENIKKDIDKRERCRIRIDKYLNTKRIKPLSTIMAYLKNELSIHKSYFITWDGKSQEYFSEENYYSRFTVHFCFPKDNIRVICSERFAGRLYYSKHLLNGDFKEKYITFRFYHKKAKTICNGPRIIISMATLDSIICNNGKNLEEFLKGS